MRYVVRIAACALLITAAVAANAQAQPDPNFILGNAVGDAIPGMNSRAVSISLTNPTPVCGLHIDILYDNAILKPVPDPTLGAPNVAYELTARTEGDPPIIAVAETAPGVLTVFVGSYFLPSAPIPAGSGAFVKVMFDVATTAPLGAAALSAGTNCVIYDDCDDGNIHPTCSDGSFFLGTPGDLNGDGYVDSQDLGIMVDYLYMGGVPPYRLNPADMNADYVVDSVDLGILIDYIFFPPVSVWWGCVE